MSHRMLSPSASRVASRWLTTAGDDVCRTLVSYGWVDPNGKLHLVGGLQSSHGHWARKYIRADPKLSDEVDEWAKGHKNIVYSSFLFTKGWIGVSNIQAIVVWTESTPSRKAWSTVAEMAVGCALMGYTKHMWSRYHVNEDESIRVMSVNGPDNNYSFGDFVRKFGGRQAETALYKKLVEFDDNKRRGSRK